MLSTCNYYNILSKLYFKKKKKTSAHYDHNSTSSFKVNTKFLWVVRTDWGRKKARLFVNEIQTKGPSVTCVRQCHWRWERLQGPSEQLKKFKATRGGVTHSLVIGDWHYDIVPFGWWHFFPWWSWVGQRSVQSFSVRWLWQHFVVFNFIQNNFVASYYDSCHIIMH